MIRKLKHTCVDGNSETQLPDIYKYTFSDIYAKEVESILQNLLQKEFDHNKILLSINNCYPALPKTTIFYNSIPIAILEVKYNEELFSYSINVNKIND